MSDDNSTTTHDEALRFSREQYGVLLAAVTKPESHSSDIMVDIIKVALAQRRGTSGWATNLSFPREAEEVGSCEVVVRFKEVLISSVCLQFAAGVYSRPASSHLARIELLTRTLKVGLATATGAA